MLEAVEGENCHVTSGSDSPLFEANTEDARFQSNARWQCSNCKNKRDYIESFYRLSPKHQPDDMAIKEKRGKLWRRNSWRVSVFLGTFCALKSSLFSTR
jgi:hypothetical protein